MITRSTAHSLSPSYHTNIIISRSQLLLALLMILMGSIRCQNVDCTDVDEYKACIVEMNAFIVDNIASDEMNAHCTDTEAVSVNIQELQLTCMVQQNVGINFIRWTFYPSDGSPHFDIKFGSGSRFENSTDGLTVRNVQSEDEGVYFCIVNEDESSVVVARPAGCIIVQSVIDSIEMDSTMNVSVNLNANIVLPTTITYDGAGYCNVNPVIDSIQLRFNQTDVFICTRTDQCDSENNYDLTVEYDFESKGDIVIESSPTFDNGSYIFGVVQSCPGVVLRMTYDIMSGIIPDMTSLNSMTSSVIPVETSTMIPPDVSTAGTIRDGALAASILVPLIVIVLLVAVFVALFSLIYIRRKKKFHIFTSREPMYEEPQKVNGIPPLLEREESDYTLPSTRDGNGQYLESIVLPEKATDSKEAKI